MSTTRVRMLVVSAGPAGVVRAGQEVVLPDEEAQALITGGFAEACPPAGEPAGDEPVYETGAAAGAEETTARRAGRRSGG